MHWPALALLVFQTQPPLVFSSSADLVHVVVSVTDRSGQPVRGLRARDFTVLEDDKTKPIDTFASCADVSADTTDVCAVDFVLLLDTSNSMQPHLRRARDAAVDFAKAVPAARGRRVLSFDTAIRRWTYNEADPGATLDEILEAGGGGATRLFDAIREGIAQITKSASRRPVVVALTDGEDSGATLRPEFRRRARDFIRPGWGSEDIQKAMQGEPVEQVAAALQAEGVTFYAIGFSEHLRVKPRKEGARKVLDGLARATGGLVVDGDSNELGAQFARIRHDISAQYILGFTPTASPSGRAHRVRVKVAVDKANTRHRQAYISR